MINTATTIITFLMVFVIQNTQNRDTAAMHIKIDELIRVTQKARNVLLDLEALDDQTLELCARTTRSSHAGRSRRRGRQSVRRKCRRSPPVPNRGRASQTMTDQEKAPRDGEPAKDRPSQTKRFYTDVDVKQDAQGFAVLLDGKPVRTPGKAAFLLPSAAFADAVAEEWRGQGARIDPATMPLTRLANSIIDGVKGREEAVIGDILNYAGSDLLCYRAEGPQGLVARQTKQWDPIVAWAKQDLGAPMRLAEGVMHVKQPQASLDALRARLRQLDSWSLAALHVMTGLSGSALLALATALGRLSAEDSWAAAHVDEEWQISQWGEDEQARAGRENRFREFAASARMLDLLRG